MPESEADFPVVPTDVLGPPSANPLADGLQLAGQNVVLLTAIVSPLALVSFRYGLLVHEHLLRATPVSTADQLNTADLALLLDVALAIPLVLACSSALEVAAARIAGGQPVSILSAYQAGLRRIGSLALNLLLLGIVAAVLQWPTRIAQGAAQSLGGDVPWQSPERLAQGLTLVVLSWIPSLLLIRVQFVEEFAVLAPGQDGVSRSWRLSSGHFWEIARTLLPVLLILTLLRQGPGAGAWLLGVGKSPSVAVATGLAAAMAALLEPFLVMVRVLLWHRLRCQATSAATEREAMAPQRR